MTDQDSKSLAAPAPDGAAPQQARSRIDSVGFWAALGVTLVLVLMFARVAQLQLAPGRSLAGFMSGRVAVHSLEGMRGDILDRKGRVMAATRVGYRVFVDPTALPAPQEEALTRLALAAGLPFEQVAQRVAPKIADNERQRAATEDGDPWTEPDGPLIRYVSIGGVLDDDRVDSVRGLGIPGVHLETRSVREVPSGDLAGAILGRVGIDHDGLMGAEKFLERQLEPTPGQLSYVRDGGGRPLWVYPGGYRAPQRGKDVRLSLDQVLQQLAVEELERGVVEADAAGGRLVMLDPRTGEVLAMADIIRDVPGVVEYPWTYPIGQEPGGKRPRYRTIRGDAKRGEGADLARNRCVEDVYEPGSTFKAFMWSATTELGLARPDELFDTEGGHWRTPYGRAINDVIEKDIQTWTDVLVNSSNIGMVKATSRMSFPQMREAVLKFGFGRRTGIGLPGESPGIVTGAKAWSKYTQTSVASGYEVAVTPIQMVRAFSAFARSGEHAGTLPPVRLMAVGADDPTAETGTRVLPADVAVLARQTMRGVTSKLDERLVKADPEGAELKYIAFGKSGTAEIPLGPPPPGKKRPKGSDGYFQGQYNSSFIAAAPAEEPRLVVLVVIDDPGPGMVATRRHYGAAVAGPVVRRVLERALTYLGVPPDRMPETGAVARGSVASREAQ